MKHRITVAVFIQLVLVVGCGRKQQVEVTFVSDPPGGTLYKQSGELWGPCPKVLWYDLDAEALETGYLKARGLTVRWPTGPEEMSDELIRIPVNSIDRRVVFTQPKDEPKAIADTASSQESKTPDEKQTEKELQTAETEPIKKTMALNSEIPAVADEPLAGPVGRILTLSKQQLILLDWRSSNRRGARVDGKRPVGGPGVEFDIYFPSNSHGSCSLSFVSSGAGGRGSLVGTDVRGYDVFALSLTLVSVNGRSDPTLKQKLVAGAVIGPTAEGRLTGYEPVTLGLAASEKTVTAQTAVSTDEIYEIGFHIHALNHDDWHPSGSRVVLRVEPVEI